ncbi:eukaryotic translation initiation factor 4 gamma 1-like [Mercenaria mercenaria]|uniref:eukaryotic translation initiation factor 4 gamma 1-like n=1 Tax=Mercenaria mercenaria TaxID=6596 RepID=UPI00234F0E7F|nr:eukaryotic translation initiation factor 4 gamma 1-like [Mercenaria mercenaria]
MNVRPRYPNPANPQSMIYGPQMIYAMGQGNPFPGQQQIIMNASMIQQQRMPSPQYNAGGMQSNQTGYIHQMPPQQPPISYSQGYGNQPLFMGSQATSQRPPSTQGQPQQQYAKPKEKKHILSIVDPNSGKDVTAEILKTTQSSTEVTGSSDSGSRSTPVGNAEEAQAQSGESNAIAAQFAALVAAKLYHPPDGESPPSQTPPPSQQQQVPPTHGAVPGAQAPNVASGGEHAHPVATGPSPAPPVQELPAQIPIQPQSVHVDSATDSSKTHPSLSNGAPVPPLEVAKPLEVVKPSEVQPVVETETATTNVDSSASNAKKSVETSEPVTVSVISAPVVSERTTVSDEHSDSSSGREMTPEVNIVPPTPVEKKPDMEIPETIKEPTKSEEPVAEVSVPKKQKSKSKKKDLNKKGEQIAGSEFDAYTDTSVPVEPEQPEATPSVPEVPEPVEETPKPAVPEEPVAEKTTESETPSPTPTDENIPKVEIKIEDENDELEEGEIVDDEEEETMSMGLRYKYAEEQWSPLNPEGKKHYDREFLLQFQNDYNAIQKPAGLPDIPDIILDKPQGMGRQFSREMAGGSSGGQEFIDFTPKYVWGGGGGGGGGQKPRGLPRQPSNQKNKSGPPTRHINVSISKDIELHKAKEAWKPSHTDAKKEKEKETGEEDAKDANTEELYKKTRSILNKLTPQKFQTLVSQMQALPIDSENKLKGVIDLVFEKAISEPGFSVAYANMCRCLSMFKVQSESKPGEMVNFRAVLLTRCQREFEKDKSSEALFITKREEIEKAEDGAKKEELKQDLAYEESKAKRRSLGNIRFIGELFKLKMLTENIMHDCVFKLLRTKDPENLECLCRLLTTIGKELDVDKAKPRMDQYFQQMGKIVNEKKTSSRVRFMLQDVMDLRTNKWVPRRVDNNPKTIDQIHKEVAQEAQEKALLSQQNQMQQRAQRGGRRGGPPDQRGGGADGWNTVVGNRTPLKSVDRSIDPSKMKLSKQNVDESAIQLGPGGGAGRFSGWGRGSTGGTTGRPSQEKEKPNTPANRFSALSRPDEDQGRRFGGVSPARGEGRGRGFGRPPSLGARRSQESERERAVAAAKAIGASQSVDGGHRERSRGRAEPEPQPSPVQPASTELKVLSEKDMEKKTKAILDEYFAIQDMKEAILCVQELSAQNHHHFVYNAINHVLERSSQARKQTGHILHDLVKQTVISVDNYIKGLVEVLEFAEDLEIDIPKIWQYYGELISPMIQDNSVPLSFLKQAAAPLIANNKAGVLLAEILHDASHREGHKKVAGLWTSSGLHWSDFVPKNQVEQFLKDKGLEYTNGGDSAPTTPTTGLPLKEIEVKLHELIVQNKADNESVFDWIEGNVDDPTTRRAKFIRALMTAVCYSAIKGDKGKERLEPKEISARNDLLQKYLDHQADSELQALYAVQALIAKLEHPQGVLRGMFDTLYDEDIISEDAFFQWEKSEEEPEGKGVCLKQAIQFFTWLREAEEDS